jgi:hypothetical protein
MRRLALRVSLVVAIVASTAGTLVTVTEAPASASECSSAPGCGGEVINNATNYGAIWVTNQWCWSPFSGKQEATTAEIDQCIDHWSTWEQARAAAPLPPDDNDARSVSNVAWSSAHGSRYWDVDAIKFPGGCVTTIWVPIANTIGRQAIDRRGKDDRWIKITDSLTVYIGSVVCDGSPAPPDYPTTPTVIGGGSSSDPGSTLPSSISVKRNDYTRDSISDLVGVRSSDGCIARWRGNGNGGLDYFGDYGCGWNNYTELAGVGDITRDGVGDLVAVRRSDGCLARWRGNGNGGLDYFGDYGCGWNNYNNLT